MTVDAERVVRLRAEELAVVLARLRRRITVDEYGCYLLDVACGHVEVMHNTVSATAAAICAGNHRFGADDEVAVEAALADVDDRVRRLRGLLGVKPT